MAPSSINARITSDDPFLIVRADQLYDWRLLRKVACEVEFRLGVDAVALIDTAPSTLNWAAGAHCSATCKNDRCHALVKVRRHGERVIAACGHRLDACALPH